MEHTTIAVDLAQHVFQVAVSTRVGQVEQEHRLSRPRFLRFFAQQPPATVVFEACGTAHYWGRQLQQLGHAVHLLPAHDVRRYVRRNKTDRADAKALLEAHRNQEIHTVPVKTVEQQALASLHRIRRAWLRERTARLNMVRGLLREFGLVIPVGAHRVIPQVREWLTDTEVVPALVRGALASACDDIERLDEHLTTLDRQLTVVAAEHEVVRRLVTIPGIGVLTATAFVASLGDIRRFRSSRHLASFLGLTPKERSSGERRRLGAISKQGDVSLRMLLVHGARSLLWSAQRQAHVPSRLHQWGGDVRQRRGWNIATVAVANKLARRVWAVWRGASDFVAEPPRP